MSIYLGLDIGSNSVGSAWVDTEARTVTLGCSVFPAGVEESEAKRGTPKGAARREKRSQRRSIARRALRKRRLRQTLADAGLLPADPDTLDQLMNRNPWHLRRAALTQGMSLHEFGRILIHLNQRRGALGVETDPDDRDEGKVKEAIDHLRAQMLACNAQTFGQYMADLYDQRQRTPVTKEDTRYCDPIRNRQDAFEFHADRSVIRDEFQMLWEKQKSLGGELARILTDDLRRALDDPSEDPTWRHSGGIFGQRRTYWDAGTLGRCDLEPTDHRCPRADMYVQEFRVLQSVNNMRIVKQGETERPLNAEERDKVISALRTKKTGSVTTVRRALGINTKAGKETYTLNLERDPEAEINTDWFYREVVSNAITGETCPGLTDRQRESVNRAILKFDPASPQDAERLRQGAQEWWGLSPEAADRLVDAWKERPKIESRVNLSRRAIRNLLPYLRAGLSVTNARQRFAEDPDSPATAEQRARYAFNVTDEFREFLGSLVGDEEADRLLGLRGLTKGERHYLSKHPDLLPPAPTLANPVVRKAVHEVRRHVTAYLTRFGRKPDRVIIELAREAKQTEKIRNQILAQNRRREAERKEIIEQFDLAALTANQQGKAVERVTLCRQQRKVCAYSNVDTDEGRAITDETAALGTDLEVDHIVPQSRSQDNGLNNKVVCFRKANRGKGNQTPKEWLPPEQFERLCQRFGSWKKDLRRKWENLTRDAPSTDEFAASQLTDTAYAATQVGEYLNNALYGGQTDARKHVLFTKGFYTAMLRRDWGLAEGKIDEQWHGEVGGASSPSPGSARRRKKDRTDHRHHAIDAAVIALSGPATVQQVARDAAWQAEHRERTGLTPKRPEIGVPWGTKEEFRGQILEAAGDLVVCHRPTKRKLIGWLHKETLHGPVPGHDELFTSRKPAAGLTPNHLRMPEGWTELARQLADGSLTDAARRHIRRQLAALADRPPERSGIVRDRNLRHHIRRCLEDNGLDPDRFTPKDIKKLVTEGRLHMHSGVPIKRAVLLRTIADPIVIPRKRWDDGLGRLVDDDNPRSRRVYESQNNHHIEIREDTKTGRWCGKVVDAFTAMKRARSAKGHSVDRTDGEGQRFVMSIAEGETLHMRHRTTGEPGYFAVFKLVKPSTIHLTAHWDARPAAAKKNPEGREIAETKREEVRVSASQLEALSPSPDHPPRKVRVGPLGDLTELRND